MRPRKLSCGRLSPGSSGYVLSGDVPAPWITRLRGAAVRALNVACNEQATLDEHSKPLQPCHLRIQPFFMNCCRVDRQCDRSRSD